MAGFSIQEIITALDTAANELEVVIDSIADEATRRDIRLAITLIEKALKVIEDTEG